LGFGSSQKLHYFFEIVVNLIVFSSVFELAEIRSGIDGLAGNTVFILVVVGDGV